jgi:Ca2+-binding EF-hand superfamily protein
MLSNEDVILPNFSYSQEIPSRVFKLILKATDENNDGYISVQEVQNLLQRIGADNQLSQTEIEDIMNELGMENGAVGVPLAKVKDFFLPPKSIA